MFYVELYKFYILITIPVFYVVLTLILR